MSAPPRCARYRVWDLPTRVFHLALIGLVVAQYLSGEFHWLPMRWHYYGGYALIGLLVFRVLWGLVGSQTSRYADFLRGPRQVLGYLRSGVAPGVGHNPLGGWSVLVMLALLIAQSLSGLFTSDDISEAGPLAECVAERWMHLASEVHAWTRYFLALFILLHVVAVLLHYLRRGENLVGPMLHGKKSLDADPQLRFAPAWLAAVVTLAAAAATAGLLWFASND